LVNRRKFQGFFGDGQYGGEKVMLLKPETYMNRSGNSVAEAMNFYRLPEEDLLVVVDDMALELGRLRLRAQGSSGGHNGIKDIIRILGHDEFNRLRIGIGSAGQRNAIGHVLGDFRPEEKIVIEEALKKGTQAVECWLRKGIEEAMTRYNVWDSDRKSAESPENNKSNQTEIN
jgi:PTH1 family peptidyl-tRNA hydrolase